MKLLLEPNGETGGGAGSGTETLGTGAELKLLTKLFSDEIQAPPKKELGAAEQPGDEPGETLDLSHEAGETPEQIAEREETELAQRATDAGVTVEEQREAEVAEQTRVQEKAEAEGKTVEQVQEEEAAAGNAGETDLRGMTKRFSKMLTRIEKLEAENAELKAGGGPAAAPAAGADPLATITSAQKLLAVQQVHTGRLKELNKLIPKLNYAPAKVEQQMRALAAGDPEVAKRFKNAEGAEDFSVEKMGEVLEEAKGTSEDVLAAIPNRQKFLDTRQKVSRILREPEVAKLAPFLADPESPDSELFKTFTNSPELRGNPAGEHLALAVVLGLQRLQPVLKAVALRVSGKRAPGAAAAPPLKVRSKMPGTGAPGAPGGGKTKLQLAKERFQKTGKTEDGDRVLQLMGMS